MEPNNNQPINANPLEQPAAPQPVAAPFFSPVPPMQQPSQAPIPAPTVPTFTPQVPKSGSKKGIILLIILIILILGMGFYVFFAKNQFNTAQKATTDNTSTVIPEATTAPTAIPATVDEIIVASPEADLNAIENDVQGL
jgi:uncharacterized protein HemX